MADNYFDKFDPSTAKPDGGGGNYFDRFDPATAKPEPKRTWGDSDKPVKTASNQEQAWGEGDSAVPASALRKVGDLGLSVAKGVVAVPEALVGLANIPTGGRVGKFLENEGGAFGFRPKQAKEYLGGLQSDDLRDKQQQFQKADGIIDKTGVALSNPSLITNAVAESVPLMGAGAVPARAALSVAPKLGAVAAGAIGEGVVGAGSAAEGIRQETADGLMTAKQSGLALASGAATSAFGFAGGKMAQRLGIGDVDTMLTQGTIKTAGAPSAKSIPRQVVEGAIAEGWLEELPQSVSEQVLQNLALDKPWHEGVDDAAVMGTLAGMAMGGAAAGVSGFAQDKPPADAQPPIAPPAPPQPQAGPTLALPAPDPGVIAVDSDGTARTPAYQKPSFAGEYADVTDVVPRALAPQSADPVRAAVESAANAGGALSGAALVGIDTGASQQMADAVQAQAQADVSDEAAKGSKNAAQEQPVPFQPAVAGAESVGSGALSPEERSGLATTIAGRDLAGQPLSPEMAGLQAQLTQVQQRAAENGSWNVPLMAQRKRLEDAIAKLKPMELSAERQAEAANSEGATLQASPGAPAVSAAGPGALEASGPVTTSTTTGAASEPQADQTQQAAAQPAQAGPAQPAQGLTDAAPAENHGAQGTPAPGAQAQTSDAAPAENREQRAQRIAAAGESWTRMPAAEREALAARADGLNPIQRKRVPSAAWASLNVNIQRKLAEAMGGRKEYGGNSTGTIASASPVAINSEANQAENMSLDEQLNKANDDTPAKWNALTYAQRMAIATEAGLNEYLREQVSDRQWAGIGSPRSRLHAVMQNQQAAAANPQADSGAALQKAMAAARWTAEVAGADNTIWIKAANKDRYTARWTPGAGSMEVTVLVDAVDTQIASFKVSDPKAAADAANKAVADDVAESAPAPSAGAAQAQNQDAGNVQPPASAPASAQKPVAKKPSADQTRAKADLMADIAANPVPPPAWLRAGASVESAAFRNGKEFLVTGHRWNADGWFVLAQDAKGEVAIPFAEVTDAQGMPVYEPREFEAPEVHTKEAKAPKVDAAAAPADDGTKFSRTPATKAAYEARIDALFSDAAKASRDGVKVLDSSDVMGLLGQERVPLVLSETHVLHDGRTNHPEMTAEVWKRVPEWIENPAAVYTDPKHPGKLTIVAPERLAGYPVLIAVEPNTLRGKPDHLLVTAFAKTTGDLPAYGYLASSGRLRYADTKKAPEVWRLIGDSPRPNRPAPGAKPILSEKHLGGYRRANTPAAFMGQPTPPADSNARNVATLLLVDGLKAKWTRAPEIIVARNMQDTQIPQAVRDYDATLKSQGASGEARGFIYKGKVYLLSDQLMGPQQIAEVLFHEVLGHYGLRGAFGNSLDTILQQLGTMRRRDVVAKAREYGLFDKDALGIDPKQASNRQIWDAMSAKQRMEAAEEVLAEMAQTQPNIGFVQRAIAAIRNWLRAHVPGFERMRLTDADIVQAYILPARGYVTRSNETAQQAIDRAMLAFNRGAGTSQPQTDAFKRWFGDSKVVDAEGKPLVMYHGTGSDFSVFDQKRIGSVWGADRMGFFFTDSKPQANTYAASSGLTKQRTEGSTVMPTYLSIKRPVTLQVLMDFMGDDTIAERYESPIEVMDDFRDDIEAMLLGDPQKNWAVNTESSTSKENAHDGIFFQLGGETLAAAVDSSQIKSSIGNNGSFDPDNPDIRFSRASSAAAAGAAIKSVTATHIKQRAGFKATDYLGLGLQALGRRQIVDIYGDMLPLAEYNTLVTQMEADKNEGGAEADKLVKRWAELPDEGKLADLMHEATLAQIDPAKPYVGGDDKAKYAMLAGRFNALSQEAKQVYTDTRDAYQGHHAKVRSAIKERIERSELKGPRKAELLKQMDDEFFAAVKGVYFPLARFGQYAVTVKGADGKVESVSRAETKAEAEALRNSLLSAFPRDKGFTVGRVMLSKDFIADRDAVGRGFMTELYQVLDKQDMDAAQRAELEDTLGQLYLSSLPDLSWAKHGIHRKGTPGFSQDARRAYAQNMFHGSRYLAKLRYSDLMQDELTAMQKHVDDWREAEDFDQNSAQRVVDEMNKRHESLMNPKSNPLSTALTSFGFIFYLGLSPASAMVNLSQTALVAYPIMGAKWGFGKASAALLKASAEAAKGKNDITGSLNADERAAYDEAVRAGTIDVTMAHDLAGIAQGEDAGVMWKIRPVMRWASLLFHHAERFNRQVTFVASYRLAREAGADQKAAFEQATKATYDGHFDYGAANRPRVMQGNVAKVLLLFKQYGQNMVYTLARNAQQAMKAETPEARAQARKALAGLLTSHAMAAGVLGLPMVTTLLAAASMIGGDDDEPWDAKVALQNMLADTFGQKTAEVLAHGLSRLTPWDISGRVGLDRLIFPDVQEGLEGQRLAESAMAAALGPVAGIGVNVLKGAQLMSEGRYALGLEAMLPSALRGLVKAIRYANDGVQDKSGISILDEVGPAAVAGQALGFSPSQARNAQAGKSAVMAHDRALGERRQELLTRAARASMAKDAEALDDARKEIARFNEKNPGRRINPNHIMQSVRGSQKRIDQAEGGIYLPKNRRDAMEAGRFALGD